MTKKQVQARIEELGVIPAVRLSSAEDAQFAAEAVCSAGIPIVEVTMTVPGAIDVITNLVKTNPTAWLSAPARSSIRKQPAVAWMPASNF